MKQIKNKVTSEREISEDLHLGSANYVNVKASTIVSLNEQFLVLGDDGPITMIAEIKVDFAGIPERYREVCLNVLTSKYLNRVNFGDNPFSQCRPVVKRSWWQFWKNPYFTQS